MDPFRAGDDRSDKTEKLYCDSVKCSDGYSLTENAKDVECEGDKCQEKRCCETFCSFYECPDKYTSVYDPDTILCPHTGCTTDLCCEKVRITVVLKTHLRLVSVVRTYSMNQLPHHTYFPGLRAGAVYVWP